MRTVSLRRSDLVPAGLAAVLATVAVRLGWRGADWPAQLLRVELVERAGPAIWNNLWFAGHHTPGYGLLFPILGRGGRSGDGGRRQLRRRRWVLPPLGPGRTGSSPDRWRRACCSPRARSSTSPSGG